MSVDQELFADRLPTYLSRFVGREAELGELEALLMDGSRLVTLCGVGGAGKSRLAIEVARRLAEAGDHPFPDGVFWVPLVALIDPAGVPRAVASALGLREASSNVPIDALRKALRDLNLLLVLDNCEHLAGACADLISALLEACPRVVILTTSRVALHLEVEHVVAVAALSVRNGSDLFIDRATLSNPGYALTQANATTIGRICEQLDGLPLAIELAASWIRVLSARDLLTEIDRSLDVLASSSVTVASRHRSMRAVLDSSWQWLSEDDRRVFAGLGSFVGGFTREAAESVAGAGLASLASLAERSLIQRVPDSVGGTRYLVHELVRTYALERMGDADDASAEAVRARHFAYFLALVDRAEAVWDTAEEAASLELLAADQANVKAALLWALDRGHAERALRMCAGLLMFWMYTSALEQSEALLSRALTLGWDPSSPGTSRARAKALNVAGYAAIGVRDFTLAKQRFAEGLTIHERLGDLDSTAWNLRGFGWAHLLSGDVQASLGCEKQSLSICRSTGDLRGIAWSIHDLGEAAFAGGNDDEALARLEDGVARFEHLGVLFGAYRGYVMLENLHRKRGEWSAALTRCKQGLELQMTMHFITRGGDLLHGLAGVAAGLHRLQLACRLFAAADAWHAAYGFASHEYLRPYDERDAAEVRRRLGDEEWETTYAAGLRQTSEQAQQSAAAAIRELTAALESLPSGLTEREADVLRLVAVGLNNADIADRLVVSPRTVHAHLRSIFAKLAVTTRTAAAHEARRLGLV